MPFVVWSKNKMCPLAALCPWIILEILDKARLLNVMNLIMHPS